MCNSECYHSGLTLASISNIFPPTQDYKWYTVSNLSINQLLVTENELMIMVTPSMLTVTWFTSEGQLFNSI